MKVAGIRHVFAMGTILIGTGMSWGQAPPPDDGPSTLVEAIASGQTSAVSLDGAALAYNDEADDAEEAEDEGPNDMLADVEETLLPEFLFDWDTRLSVGFSGSEGDTRSISGHARLNTSYDDDARRVRLGLSYQYGRQEGRRNRNRFKFDVAKDWKLPDSPWFIFTEADYVYDEFRSWEHRITGHAGVGYELIDEEDLVMTVRGGAGGRYEFRGGRKFTPEALLGASVLRWNITESQTLQGSSTIYPNLDEWGEFRLENAVEWQLEIDRREGISIALGLEHEYQSDPLPQDRRNNLYYYGSLVFDF